MNELCVKMNLTKVAYFDNTLSKFQGPISSYVWVINQLCKCFLLKLYFFQVTANLAYCKTLKVTSTIKVFFAIKQPLMCN